MPRKRFCLFCALLVFREYIVLHFRQYFIFHSGLIRSVTLSVTYALGSGDVVVSKADLALVLWGLKV